MGEKNVTVMVLNVDLQCSKCYKKVKRVLCKFPQIQDQIFDEKQNKVIIKVVCCSPEKIRDKLCCKGDGAIKSIEILEPPKPKEPEKKPTEPEKKPKEPENKPKEPEKKPKEPAPAPAPAPMPVAPAPAVPCHPPGPNPFGLCCRECYEGNTGGPCYKLGYRPAPAPPPAPVPVAPAPSVPCHPPSPNPFGMCCRECYEGNTGGPCYELGYRPAPAPPPTPAPVPEPCYPPGRKPIGLCCQECYRGNTGGPCYKLGYGPMRHYDGYCGRVVYESWGGGCDRVYYRSRCTDYICEENPNAACTIM